MMGVDQAGDNHPIASIKGRLVLWRLAARHQFHNHTVVDNQAITCVFSVNCKGVFYPKTRHESTPRWVTKGHSFRAFKLSKEMVGDTGIEPVTTTMSMWCSTAELIARPMTPAQRRCQKHGVRP